MVSCSACASLMLQRVPLCPATVFFFFFNDTATTEIYTLSLHDALPISLCPVWGPEVSASPTTGTAQNAARSEEHTSELQSQFHLVCRLLLEKKKNLAHLARGLTFAYDDMLHVNSRIQLSSIGVVVPSAP